MKCNTWPSYPDETIFDKDEHPDDTNACERAGTSVVLGTKFKVRFKFQAMSTWNSLRMVACRRSPTAALPDPACLHAMLLLLSDRPRRPARSMPCATTAPTPTTPCRSRPTSTTPRGACMPAGQMLVTLHHTITALADHKHDFRLGCILSRQLTFLSTRL